MGDRKRRNRRAERGKDRSVETGGDGEERAADEARPEGAEDDERTWMEKNGGTVYIILAFVLLGALVAARAACS